MLVANISLIKSLTSLHLMTSTRRLILHVKSCKQILTRLVKLFFLFIYEFNHENLQKYVIITLNADTATHLWQECDKSVEKRNIYFKKVFVRNFPTTYKKNLPFYLFFCVHNLCGKSGSYFDLKWFLNIWLLSITILD